MAFNKSLDGVKKLMGMKVVMESSVNKIKKIQEFVDEYGDKIVQVDPAKDKLLFGNMEIETFAAAWAVPSVSEEETMLFFADNPEDKNIVVVLENPHLGGEVKTFDKEEDAKAFIKKLGIKLDEKKIYRK